MNRRHFIRTTSATVASSAFAACKSLNHSSGTKPLSLSVIDASEFRRMRRFAETLFGRIAYAQRGSGRAALFVHGYPLNGFQWRGAIERLSDVRRCIAPDLMALGYSEIPESQPITPHTQVEMLTSLLDTLHLDSVDVVANDSGGLIAQLLVARHPERVRTLMLTNCDTQNDCPPRSFAPFVQLARAGKLVDQAIAPALSNKSLARSAKGLGGLAYANPLNPTDDAIDYYFSPLVGSTLRKSQLDALTIALGQNALAGTESALKQFTGPVRIVWGGADTVFSASSPDWLARTFPGSQGVRRVADGKLFFPEEQPDLIADEARLVWNVRT